jgi:uncharacterized membrane protein
MATAVPAVTAPAEGTAYVPPVRQRVDSIDLLRGLVMVIMMLDHTRDFFSAAAFQFDPTNLAKTSIPLFLTRWITHFCAPVFFFLAGTGAYLWRARGATPAELSRFLVSRGIWLIVLELTVIQVGITFQLDPRGYHFALTIWALGWSMIVLGALVFLPLRVIAALGVTMIAVHNAFDGFRATDGGPREAMQSLGDKLALVLHQPGMVRLGGADDPLLFVQYPLVPWIGVMAAGYAFGWVYSSTDRIHRRRILISLGGAIAALFVVLRATNVYGDPSAWSVQSTAAFSVLSFLNVTKYPPSLLYLCMTLGPAILLLALLERDRRGRLGAALVTIGRVPMMFYVLQWYVPHAIAFGVFMLAGKPTAPLHIGPANPATPAELAQAGFSLPVVYAFWILGVLLLYPACVWFAGVKRRRSDWWLGYL